ncbi:MAG: NfrA family protein [Allosphingosinicella sp.]|uniref:NfrA family protein n=1 Tax=Allosphingosinicella sp. TaxID=2823234 RepID=UPI00395C7619
MRLKLLAGAALAAASPAFAQAPAPGSPAFEAAARAYAAADRGDRDAALREARAAAAAAPGHRDYRLLLFHSLIAAGERAEAEQVASALVRDFGTDPAFDLSRAALLAELERRAEARALLSEAIASGRLTPAEERTARLTLADVAQADQDPRAALAALAPLPEFSYDVLARRGFARSALGHYEAALSAFDDAFHLAVAPDRRALMARSRIGALAELGRRAEARAAFDSHLAAGLFADMSPLDLAYLASSAGADAEARTQFARAEAAGTLRGSALLDAGYAARRAGDDAAAIRYFEAALAENRAGTLPLEPQSRYYVVQEVATLTRTFGGYLSASRGQTGTWSGAPAPAVGAAYAGGEIYWRPPALGRQVDVFARAFMTLDADQGATGGDTLQGYAGVRWRPFLDYNLVFEGSYLFPIGDQARTDWLVRAAYSIGQGGDVRFDRPNWANWSVYGEVGHFLRTGQTVANAEARYGRGFALGGHVMATPFVGARAAYDSALARQFSLGAGPGVSLRSGLGGNPWRAPAAFLDLTLQYRFPVAGGEQGEGVFAGATLSY